LTTLYKAKYQPKKIETNKKEKKIVTIKEHLYASFSDFITKETKNTPLSPLCG